MKSYILPFEFQIVSKDGGLLLKDNFGGATWAYEVGSQSMVCPIIVEDLNQPHQMLVEVIPLPNLEASKHNTTACCSFT